VNSFDSLPKEKAFNIIESAVIKKDFNINFDLSQALFTFEAVDIFPATLDSTSNNNQNGQSIKIHYKNK